MTMNIDVIAFLYTIAEKKQDAFVPLTLHQLGGRRKKIMKCTAKLLSTIKGTEDSTIPIP